MQRQHSFELNTLIWIGHYSTESKLILKRQIMSFSQFFQHMMIDHHLHAIVRKLTYKVAPLKVNHSGAIHKFYLQDFGHFLSPLRLRSNRDFVSKNILELDPLPLIFVSVIFGWNLIVPSVSITNTLCCSGFRDQICLL